MSQIGARVKANLTQQIKNHPLRKKLSTMILRGYQQVTLYNVRGQQKRVQGVRKRP